MPVCLSVFYPSIGRREPKLELPVRGRPKNKLVVVREDKQVGIKEEDDPQVSATSVNMKLSGAVDNSFLSVAADMVDHNWDFCSFSVQYMT